MTTTHHRVRFPPGRRAGISALIATLTLVVALAFGYLVVCVVLRLPTPWVNIDTVRSAFNDTSWNEPVVLAVGIGLGTVGSLLIIVALMPAARRLQELTNPDPRTAAAMSKASLRRTVRAAALTVDGVRAADAHVGTRRIRLNVRTGLRHTRDLPSSAQEVVSGRLQTLDLARPRTISVRLHREEI